MGKFEHKNNEYFQELCPWTQRGGLTAPAHLQLHLQRANARCSMTIGNRKSIMNAKTEVRKSTWINPRIFLLGGDRGEFPPLAENVLISPQLEKTPIRLSLPNFYPPTKG